MNVIHKISMLRAQPVSHWVDSANSRLPGMISVILVIGIAWYLARFVWIMVPVVGEFDWSIKPSGTANLSAPFSTTAQVNFRTIVSAHLFGAAGTAPVTIKAVDAPETRLNLKLRGTIAAGDKKYAHAIIGDGKGKNEVYFVDDAVPGGAILHAVYPDKIILNRAGALETFALAPDQRVICNASTAGSKDNPGNSGRRLYSADDAKFRWFIYRYITTATLHAQWRT